MYEQKTAGELKSHENNTTQNMTMYMYKFIDYNLCN